MPQQPPGILVYVSGLSDMVTSLVMQPSMAFVQIDDTSYSPPAPPFDFGPVIIAIVCFIAVAGVVAALVVRRARATRWQTMAGLDAATQSYLADIERKKKQA